MLNLPNSNILLCVEPTDMRKSFDSLAMLVRRHIGGDPLSESWFVFHGKKNDRLKILYWDRDVYALWYKRLEAGTFQFPIVTRDTKSAENSTLNIDFILNKIDLALVRKLKRFQLTKKGLLIGTMLHLKNCCGR
jgi:transposase